MIYKILLIVLIIEFIICRKNIYLGIGIFFAITFLIPYVISFSFGSIKLNVFNLSSLIFAVCSFKYILSKKVLDKTVLNLIIFISIYHYIVSLFTSLDDLELIGYIKYTILHFCEFFLVPFCLLFVKFEKDKIHIFNKILTTLAVIIGIYAIINYVIKINPYIAYICLITDSFDMQEAFLSEQRGVLEGRVSSTFVHPLILGQTMLLCISYLFFQLRNINKIIFGFIFCLFYVTIFFSGSRSTLIPAIIIPIIFIIYSSAHNKIKYILIILFILPFAVISIPKDYRQTIEGLICFWDTTKVDKAGIVGSNTDMRETQIADAFKIVENDLLFGKGNGYIKEKGSDHPEMLGYEGLLLYTIIEYGVIGTIIFLTFYYLLFRKLYKSTRLAMDKAQILSLNMTYFLCIILTGISYTTFSTFLSLNILILNDIKNRQECTRLIRQ